MIERFRDPRIPRTIAATLIAGAAIFLTSQYDHDPSANKLPVAGALIEQPDSNCLATTESQADGQHIDPMYARDLNALLADYNQHVQPVQQPGGVFDGTQQITVSGQNKSIDVQVYATSDPATLSSLELIDAQVIDTRSGDFYMRQSVAHDAKDGWRARGSYLTSYHDPADTQTYHYESNLNAYTCGYLDTVAQGFNEQTKARMEYLPAEASVVTTELLGRLTVLLDFQQSESADLIFNGLPGVSDRFWKDSGALPPPDDVNQITNMHFDGNVFRSLK